MVKYDFWSEIKNFQKLTKIEIWLTIEIVFIKNTCATKFYPKVAINTCTAQNTCIAPNQESKIRSKIENLTKNRNYGQNCDIRTTTGYNFEL